MTFNVIEGDLFSGDYEAIGHGVNTFGVMGAGIAVEFKKRYPLMYEEYALSCKVGALLPGQMMTYYTGGSPLWVYNLASQDMPGPNARKTWLSDSVYTMMWHANRYGVKSIGLPAIGCGIGGLKLDEVTEILTNIVRPSGIDVTMVLYKP